MKRQIVIATAIVALFFGFGLVKQPSKASDQTQRPLRVLAAVKEDFQGSSKIVYFMEGEDGTRVPLAEGVVPSEGRYKTMNAQSVQGTTGVKRLAVILTNFTDDAREPMTLAEAQERVFGTGPDSLASRFSRNSYGQLTLVGQVFGWVTVTPPIDTTTGKPFTGCDRGYFANQAARQAAGAAGFDNYMLFVPSEADCGFSGFADIIGNSSTLFGYFDPRAAVHELGHNFGLLHSRYINYNGSQSIGTESCFGDLPACEYGDRSDPMGTGEYSFFTFNKVKLGWIPPTDSITIDSANHDQFITLIAGEQPFGTRDIAIPLNDRTGFSYHVEYRCCDLRVPGVLVHLGQPDSEVAIFNSYLVPGQQGNPSDPDTAALKLPGQVYVDTSHQVRIELVSINSNQALVHVTVPAGPLPHIDEVVLGKKTKVWGSNFGSDPVLIINGVDINVEWKKKKSSVLQTKKTSLETLNIKTGQQNTVQVKSGSQLSNLITLPF